MAIRTSFTFRTNKFGWSETFYQITNTMTVAETRANALAVLRANCLAGQSFLESWTCSFDDPQKDGVLHMYPDGGLQGTILKNYPSDMGTTALLCTLFVGSNRSRKYTMRGQPDAITDFGGKYSPAAVAPWVGVLDAYLDSLGLDGFFGMRNSIVTQTDNILTMTNTSQSVVALTVTPSVAEYVRGERVKITGGRFAMGLQGRHTIIATSTGITPQVIYVRSPYSVNNYASSSAQISSLNFGIAPFIGSEVERMVKRDTGRGFFLPVGKKSAVRKA